MAVYTKLSIGNVSEIMAKYGIRNVRSHKELHGGSQNSNYVVRTDDNAYVISICEQNDVQDAIHLADILEYLEANNFSTSVLKKTADQKKFSLWDNKPLIVKQFIEGNVLDDIPAYIVRHIGIQLGKLHKIQPPPYIPNTPGYGRVYFHEIELYADQSEYHVWLQKKSKYIDQFISEKLPKTLIHSDVFSSNVIIDKSEQFVTIMDFEEATNYYRIFDIGMTFIGVCREEKGINLNKAKSLIDGYKLEIQLTEEEIRCLQAFVVYAATAMSFWRHRNFNYTVPTPSLFNHYEELKIIADTVQQIDSKEFLKILF